MRSLSIIEDQIICQSGIKERFVMNNIQMVINKFFLKGTVIPFDVGIDFRATGVREEVRDSIGFELIVKLSQVFRAIVRLPVFNGNGIDLFKAMVKIFHITAGQTFVVEGEDKLESGINGRKEVVFNSIGESLYSIREDVSTINWFWRMFNSKSFGFLPLVLRPFGVWVVIDSA